MQLRRAKSDTQDLTRGARASDIQDATRAKTSREWYLCHLVTQKRLGKHNMAVRIDRSIQRVVKILSALVISGSLILAFPGLNECTPSVMIWSKTIARLESST